MFSLQNTHYAQAHLSGVCTQRDLVQPGVFWASAEKVHTTPRAPYYPVNYSINTKKKKKFRAIYVKYSQYALFINELKLFAPLIFITC